MWLGVTTDGARSRAFGRRGELGPGVGPAQYPAVRGRLWALQHRQARWLLFVFSLDLCAALASTTQPRQSRRCHAAMVAAPLAAMVACQRATQTQHAPADTRKQGKRHTPPALPPKCQPPHTGCTQSLIGRVSTWKGLTSSAFLNPKPSPEIRHAR